MVLLDPKGAVLGKLNGCWQRRVQGSGVIIFCLGWDVVLKSSRWYLKKCRVSARMESWGLVKGWQEARTDP